jgi:hypothetical protein
MAGGYQVSAAELANGTKLVQGVSDQAESIASALAGTFASLVDAAGNEDLAGALAAVDGTCAARILDVLALLGHIGETLGDNARSYQQAEDKNTQSLNTVAPRGAR